MVKTPEPNYELGDTDLTDDTEIAAAGGTNTQTLRPPIGKIYEIIDIFYSSAAPIGATANTHQLSCRQTFISTSRQQFLVKGAFNSSIEVQNGMLSGNDTENPTNAREQYICIRRRTLIAGYNTPLLFIYTNDSDANKTGNRILEIYYKIKSEAIL